MARQEFYSDCLCQLRRMSVPIDYGVLCEHGVLEQIASAEFRLLEPLRLPHKVRYVVDGFVICGTVKKSASEVDECRSKNASDVSARLLSSDRVGFNDVRLICDISIHNTASRLLRQLGYDDGYTDSLAEYSPGSYPGDEQRLYEHRLYLDYQSNAKWQDIYRFLGREWYWHVTTKHAWESIQQSGAIKPNRNGQFSMRFEDNSRKSYGFCHGYSSLFDFSTPSENEVIHHGATVAVC